METISDQRGSQDENASAKDGPAPRAASPGSLHPFCTKTTSFTGNQSREAASAGREQANILVDNHPDRHGFITQSIK
jgi:hypothetical protein